jgi:CheY-like chemotaxis protein
MRVLIVEDQPDVAAVMSALVGQLGHETVVAPAGKDAMRACLRTKPDLVLMDIELPDIDGYELTKRLKSQFDLRKVPVWVVSSLSDNKYKRDAAGMTGYLQKPVSARGLERVLDAVASPA